ncbi:ATP-binding protein [Streptomyces sp. MC1]|uniref:ATP-binding protein n=1 Tax=Streptomyces sp. MC1 TaxID=295105 RepID=UPI0018CB5F73|nr:ATP-binding protein [Streptomyces sp. MC1]MBG7704902.1 ATP-binding protein [Streptomyces sp. MC1]
MSETRVKEPDDMSMTAALPPGVTTVDAASAKVLSILQRRGIDPARAGLTDDRADDPAEYQAEVYWMAWRNSLRRAGLSDYLRYRLSDLGQEEREFVKDYIDQHIEVRQKQREQHKLHPDQRQHIRPLVLNAILAGTVGAGKTVTAVAAARYAVERGLMARLVPHTLYLSWLRPNGAPTGMTATQVIEFYERCDVLVLDEVAGQMDGYATNFVRTCTYDLINARVNSNRPTLFTTNLSSEQIIEVLGEALYSRIGTRAEVLEMTGDDRRMPKTWGVRRTGSGMER